MTDNLGKDTPDPVHLLLLATVVVGLGVVSPAGISGHVVHWLIQHHVVVSTSQALVQLPKGVGLDLRRLILGAGVLILVGSLAGMRRRRGVVR